MGLAAWPMRRSRSLHRRFGATMRRDAWWVQPAVVFLVLSSFIVYATWAAFQGAHYTYGPYLSPFYSPELFGDSPHAWFGPKPGLVAGLAAVLAGAADPAVPGALPGHLLLLSRRVLQGVLGGPAACTVGEPRKSYRGEASFPLILQNVHRYFLYVALLLPGRAAARRVEGAVVHGRRRARTSFGIGVGHARARDQRRPARRLHARLPLDAARDRRVPRPAGAPPGAPPRLRLLELPQPRRTCAGPGAACSPSPSPTSTSGSARWASGPTGGSSEPTTRPSSTTSSSSAPAAPGCARPSPRPAPGARVGLVCKSLLGKAHTVMAEGGVAAALAQRGRPRQLAGPLRRHDARRAVRQQLAHGRAARQGGARPGARARGVGRAVRPHAGRPDPPAQLRRPQVSAAGARGRPHRPGDDPHAAGPRHPPGHRRAHGMHGAPAVQRTASGSRARWATTASAAASGSSAARPSCSPPAGSAGRTRSPATAGSTPATATRSPTTPARRCRTWSSCSSIPPA